METCDKAEAAYQLALSVMEAGMKNLPMPLLPAHVDPESKSIRRVYENGLKRGGHYKPKAKAKAKA